MISLANHPLGFGAFKIGRNQKIKYPDSYELPTDQESDRFLNEVLDAGIQYFDTAPAYGLSEERIGRALSHRRQEFVLSTKVGEIFEEGESTYDFSASAVHASLDQSLKRLKTELLDIVFIHAPANDLDVLRNTDVVDVLKQRQSAGDIQLIGFSGKTVEAAEEALEWAEVLMVEYHLEDRTHEQVIEKAAQKKSQVVIKKGLSAGALGPDEAIRFVLGNPNVSSLVVGSLNLNHLKANDELARSLIAHR